MPTDALDKHQLQELRDGHALVSMHKQTVSLSLSRGARVGEHRIWYPLVPTRALDKYQLQELREGHALLSTHTLAVLLVVPGSESIEFGIR